MEKTKASIYLMQMIKLFLIFICFTSCNDEVQITPKSLTDYIPSDTQIIFKINNLKEAKKMLKANTIIAKTHAIELIEYFTSFPGQDQMNPYQGLLCFSEVEKDQLEYTLISKLNYTSIQNDAFKKIEMENKKHQKEKFFAQKYGANTIYVMQKDSMLITSSSQKIMESIIQQQTEDLTINKSFTKAYARTSNGRPMSVLLNGDGLIDTYNQMFPFYEEKSQPIFNGWIAINIDMKTDKMMLNSKIKNDTSNTTILGIFRNTISKKSRTAEITPSFAKGFTSYTYNNYTILKENLARLEKRDQMNIPSILDDLLLDSSEISLVSFENESALVLRSDEVFGIAQKYNTKTVLSYWDTDVHQFEAPKAFEKVLSPLVKNFSANFYFMYENFIVFAENIEVLKTFIINIKNDDTIKNEKWYKETIKHISDSASIFMFKNPQNFQYQIKQGVAQKYREMWHGFDTHKRHTKSVSVIQDKNSSSSKVNVFFNKTDDNYSTSAISKIASVKLDNEILNTPVLVKNSLRKELDVIVQDIDNQLYLFSNSGELIWKKQLDGPIIGKVEQIDLKENKGYYFAFNTKRALYLLDNFGNDSNNYPMKFEKPITQPLAIFNYGKVKNYRLVVTIGKNTLSYNANGKMIQGFQMNTAKSNLINPPKHLRMKNQGYAIFQEESGTLGIVDRRGKKLLKIRKKIAFSKNEWYRYRNFFVSTNTKGQLVKIDQLGRITFEDLNLKPNHSFYVNKGKFITLSENVLTVGDVKILLEKGVAYSDPTIVVINKHEYISISNLQSGEIFLYDAHGSLYPNFPIPGNSEISFGNMDLDPRMEFVVKGDKNEVLFYKI